MGNSRVPRAAATGVPPAADLLTHTGGPRPEAATGPGREPPADGPVPTGRRRRKAGAHR
ncbi:MULTISPECIES: hypothetical protein [Kitasatospora]|uniref:hypothetical protein n=1 Tax=Kitasatospora TaxID=2063 RepID=UPI0003076A5F|nr:MULTISPECIES: hypothetical protein [Kitasatospora]